MSLQTYRRLCVYLIQKHSVRHTSAFRYHMILREVLAVCSVFDLWLKTCHVYSVSHKKIANFIANITGTVYQTYEMNSRVAH